MKFDTKAATSNSHEVGWLASRQPPIKRFGADGSLPMEIDIGEMICSGLHEASWDVSDLVEVLYDNRFMLTIRRSLIPKDVIAGVLEGRSKLLVTSYSRYFLPRMVVRQQGATFEDIEGRDQERKDDESEHDHEIVRLFSDRKASGEGIPKMGEDNKDGERAGIDRDAVQGNFIRALY